MAAGRQPPNYRIESTSEVGNLWLQRHTDMLLLASERLANHYREQRLMTPLRLDSSDRTVGMVWRDQQGSDEYFEEMLNCLRPVTVLIESWKPWLHSYTPGCPLVCDVRAGARHRRRDTACQPVARPATRRDGAPEG